MVTSIIRLFDTTEQAQQATQQLERAGVPRDAVNVLVAPPSPPGKRSDLDEMLARGGIDRADAKALLTALRQGRAVVSAMVEDNLVEDACAAISAVPSSEWGPQRASYWIIGKPGFVGTAQNETDEQSAHDRAR